MVYCIFISYYYHSYNHETPHIITQIAPSNQGEFRYTRNNPLLTHQQRHFYEDNGYILIKNSVSDQVLDRCL